LLDKYEFLKVITDTFEKCKTEEQLDGIAAQLCVMVKEQAALSKLYLKAGILNTEDETSQKTTCEFTPSTPSITAEEYIKRRRL